MYEDEDPSIEYQKLQFIFAGTSLVSATPEEAFLTATN